MLCCYCAVIDVHLPLGHAQPPPPRATVTVPDGGIPFIVCRVPFPRFVGRAGEGLYMCVDHMSIRRR